MTYVVIQTRIGKNAEVRYIAYPISDESMMELSDSVTNVASALQELFSPILNGMAEALPILNEVVDEAMEELRAKGLVEMVDGMWKRMEDRA